jgi:hypothetical protein
LLADLARGIESVHDRHADVHDDDVRRELVRECDGLFSVRRRADDLDPWFDLEQRLHHLGERQLVVDDQHMDRALEIVRGQFGSFHRDWF